MIVCVSRYRTDRLSYLPGEIVEDPKVIAYVLADSPESFAPYVAAADDLAVSAVEEAPADKAIRRGRRNA